MASRTWLYDCDVWAIYNFTVSATTDNLPILNSPSNVFLQTKKVLVNGVACSGKNKWITNSDDGHFVERVNANICENLSFFVSEFSSVSWSMMKGTVIEKLG